MVGIETAFSICYTELVKKNGIILNKLSELMSRNPANILGINKGNISIGKDGDLVLVDLNKEVVIDKENLLQKVRILHFDGRKYLWRSNNDNKGWKSNI